MRFDSIVFEVYVNRNWVDLSADVLATPEPRVSGIGIMGTSPLDRTGGTARLSFALNNSESNSQQTLGYYSPGHVNAMPGWTTGLPVRLYFVFDGIYKQLYFKINPDGITVEAGIKGKRSVKIECSNWMREAENRTIDLIEYQTSLSADEGIRRVITNMPNAPLSQSFQAGTRTFPTVFDITSKKTKALSEINKLTMSEMGYTYMRDTHSSSLSTAGEQLVFENRTWRYSQRETPSNIPIYSPEATSKLLMETDDYLLLEKTGDKILLEAAQEAVFDDGDILAMQTSYGEHIYNRAKLVSYPRFVDTSNVVLWNLENPIEIPAGGIVTGIRGSYRDPNGKANSVSGINMVAPVSSTDYTANAQEDGGGADLTSSLTVSAEYGTAEVEYSLQNTGAVKLYVITLQARGRGVYIYDSASVVYESMASIQTYGVNEIVFDMPYLSDATTLFTFSQNVDRMLLEGVGDLVLLEDGNYLRYDDANGVFDLLVSDEPETYITRITFAANRDAFNMLAFMALSAGSFIKLSESVTGITNQFTHCINGYDFEIKPSGVVLWHAVLISTLQCPKI